MEISLHHSLHRKLHRQMPTFKIILFKQKTLSDGTHPVMLQVVENRRVFRISLGFKCKPDQWNSAASKFRRNMHEHVLKNAILRRHLDKAESVLVTIQKQNKSFTPSLFKNLFKGDRDKMSTSVLEFTESLVKEFDQKGKLSNYSIYKSLKSSLQKFWGKKRVLRFPDIDYQFLKRFETYLYGRGCSGGGVHHYMRTLRAVFNQAIQRGFADETLYPFSTARNKNGYSLSHLKSTAVPRALSDRDLELIKNFNAENHPHLKQSHLFFLFSYYTWGMNFIDMALLKWTDIYDGRIHYARKKTGDRFSIAVSNNIQTILDQFPATDVPYIFPILTEFHKTEKQIRYRVHKCLRKFNLDLREIACILGIKVNITSYVIRHTFATTLMKKDVNIAKISEAMGHEDIATTMAYLKKFENSDLDALDGFL